MHSEVSTISIKTTDFNNFHKDSKDLASRQLELLINQESEDSLIMEVFSLAEVSYLADLNFLQAQWHLIQLLSVLHGHQILRESE
jgi:hypothetical protein